MRVLGRYLLPVVCCFVVVSCQSGDQKDADAAAQQVINEWALNHRYPYEIIRSEVHTWDGNDGQAIYVVLIDDENMGLHDYPVMLTFDLVKIGEQWLAELDEEEPAFEVTVMNYDGSYWSGPCTDLNERTSQSSPCLRVASQGYFDWDLKGVCVGVGLKSGAWHSMCGFGDLGLEGHVSEDIPMSHITWEEIGNGYFGIHPRKPYDMSISVPIP